MKKFLKIGCGSVVGLFVLLVLIGSLLGDDNSNNPSNNSSDKATQSQENKKQENKKQESEKKDKLVGISEELKVGDVVFKVNKIEEVNSISAANGYMKYTPDAEGAVFLKVNVTVKNTGKEMINTDSSFFKIITSDGVEYSPSTIIVADEEYFLFEGINPGLAQTGNVVFEVPSGLKGLNLQVQTGFWGTEKGIINLN